MSTDTTERALRVLGLLQARPGWAAPELARDLGVTTRTVRRDVDRLRGIGGPSLHGFQFNGAWPEPQAFSGEHVVLQYRPSVSVPEEFRRSLKGLGNITPHVLIDGSGGRGTPLDLGSVALCVGDVVSRYGLGLNIGIAGGLCAETLPAVASLVREYGLSIDAEGRLRDGDEGGVLSLDKAAAYLRAAGEVML